MPSPANQALEVLAKDVSPIHKEVLCTSTSSYPLAFGVHLFPGALAQALLEETRTFCRRIAILLRNRPDRRGVILDPLPTVSSRLVRRLAQDSCSSDIDKLNVHRWEPTYLDIEVWNQAWKLGAEWGIRNYRQLHECSQT
jgi:hypothetical protein